jgi:hypothetical protein
VVALLNLVVEKVRVKLADLVVVAEETAEELEVAQQGKVTMEQQGRVVLQVQAEELLLLLQVWTAGLAATLILHGRLQLAQVRLAITQAEEQLATLAEKEGLLVQAEVGLHKVEALALQMEQQTLVAVVVEHLALSLEAAGQELLSCDT